MLSPMNWLALFDAQEIQRLEETASAKTTKRHWIKQGYDQQMSLYGVVTDHELGESGYKRIEILSNTPYTERIVHEIYYFFLYFKPAHPYTIFIYDKDRDSVREVGRYA